MSGLTKVDLEFLKRLESERRSRPAVNHAALLKLPPRSRVAELMSLEYSNEEISHVLGYGSARGVNAIVQRIRGELGWQAV